MPLAPPFSQARRNEFVSERGQKLALVVMCKVCWRPISVGGGGGGTGAFSSGKIVKI